MACMVAPVAHVVRLTNAWIIQCQLTLFVCASDTSMRVIHLQILHDCSGFTASMRPWLHCSLGLWHLYKCMNSWVWRTHVYEWLGPMYHYLWPKSKVRAGPAGVHLFPCAQHFTRIRLAYPSFKGDLDAALAHVPAHSARRVHLVNLQNLCEVYIPIVSQSHLSDVSVNN